MNLHYVVRRAESAPALSGEWSCASWERAATLEIACFRPESSEHRPVTHARVLYDDKGLFVAFRVQDCYVRCVATGYQGPVYKDACVEFFVEPKRDKGYFNFEMNCGGTLLLRHVINPTRIGRELAEYTNVPPEWASAIQVFHSMPKTVDPEIEEPVDWTVQYFVPFALFEAFVGPLGSIPGQEWRGNFYKCAESNSHPHYASWAPVRGALNFHQPECFAPILFEI